MTSHFFVLGWFGILSLSVSIPALAKCPTSGLRNEFCHALDAVKDPEKGCHTLPVSSQEKLLCQALSDLATGGDCKVFDYRPETEDMMTSGLSLGNMCQLVNVGLSPKDTSDPNLCNNFPPEKIKVGPPTEFTQAQLCQFGTYIRRNSSIFMENRNNELAWNKLKPLMDEYLDSPVKNQTNNSSNIESQKKACVPRANSNDTTAALATDLQNVFSTLFPNSKRFQIEKKIKNLSIQLYRFLQNKGIGGSDAGLMNYTIALITEIEKNKERWVQEAKDKNKPIIFDKDSEGKPLPSPVIAFKDGRVIVSFEHMPLDYKGKDEVDKPLVLGEGGSKTVYLGLNYSKVSTQRVIADQKSPFMAIGLLKPEETEGLIKHEAAVHKLAFDTNSGDLSHVTKPLEVHSVENSEDQTNTLRTFQNYYPNDLRNFSENALSNSNIESFEGVSKESVRRSLMEDIALGVSELHEQGIHHRDLKPENIFVEMDKDGLPRAKIGDFGLAITPKLRTSNYGELAGTEGYMSPKYVKTFKDTTATVSDAVRVNNDLSNDIWAMGLNFHYIDSSFSKQDADKFLDRWNRFHSRGRLDYNDDPKGEQLGKLLFRSTEKLSDTKQYILNLLKTARGGDSRLGSRLTAEQVVKEVDKLQTEPRK